MRFINYPPKWFYSSSNLKKPNYDLIILWMLYNNDECKWSDFLQEPIEIPTGTLSRHLNKLKHKGFLEKFTRGYYRITSEGKRKMHEITQSGQLHDLERKKILAEKSKQIDEIPKKNTHVFDEFKINEYITLKLESGKTSIYMKGELFEQCKFLMLNIPIAETERFDEIESIDEAADILGWTEEWQVGVEYDIDPESEFWGHCSNLQAWYEHDYDTRILHSYIAFPLLKKLSEVGDPFAKEVFKEEIVSRISGGHITAIRYLILEGYLEIFSKEELNHLFYDEKDELKYFIISILKSNQSADIKVLKELLLTGDPKFERIIRNYLIENREKILKKIYPLYQLMDDDMGDMTSYVNTLFEVINKYLDYKEIFLYLEGMNLEPSSDVDKNYYEYNFDKDICNLILKYHHTDIAKNYLKENFYLLFGHFLEIGYKLLDDSLTKETRKLEEDLYNVLSMTKNQWIKKCKDLSGSWELSLIAKLFGADIFLDDLIIKVRSLIAKLKKSSIGSMRWKKTSGALLYNCSHLIKIIKENNLMNERFTEIFDILTTIDDDYPKIVTFTKLILANKETDLLNSHYFVIEQMFNDCLNVFNTIERRYYYKHPLYYQNPCRVFSNLIAAINGTRLFKSKYSLIEKLVTDFLNGIDLDQINTYLDLIAAIKGTKLMEESHLKKLIHAKLFPSLGGFMNAKKHLLNLDAPDFKRFSKLIKTVGKTELITELLPEIYKDIKEVRTVKVKVRIFTTLVKEIKGTDLMITNRSLIEEIFNAILTDEKCLLFKLTKQKRESYFSEMIETFKDTLYIEENLSLIKERFPEYSEKLEEIIKK